MTDWLWDHVLIPFVSRVPGFVVAAVALLFYPVLGLAVPLVLGWSTDWLATANLVGVTFAAVVSIGWLSVQLEAKDRRHLLDWTTDVRRLTAREFEWLVGELFRREGWSVRELGQQDRPDGNIDLELTRGNEHRLVQCKRWQSWQVGVDQNRAFAGTLTAENRQGRDGLFVTLSDFTDAARTEAARTGITLVDGPELHKHIDRSRRPEPCPVCARPMLLDRSPRGWWFRCTANSCTGKRDLASEPALAVDLLTQRPWASHKAVDG